MNTVSAAGAHAPRKILVPTDLTTEAHPAIAYAISLGEILRSDVDLLHVQRSSESEAPPSFVLFDAAGEYPLYWEPAARVLLREEVLAEFAHSEAGHRMAEWLRELDGHHLESHGRVAFGDPNDPAETIVAVAAEESYDLIVMATHGRGRLFTHGVAEKVVRAAPCPVVTLRVPEAKES